MSTAWQRFTYWLKSGPPAPGTAQRRLSTSTKQTVKRNPLVDLPLDDYLVEQLDASWTKLLANVHPKGSVAGAVVASPSKAKPDYWYQWTRDSAIVMRNVVKRYITSQSPSDETLIREYIEASRIMQHKETVLGGFAEGGLGDVKYYVDEEHSDPAKKGNEPFMGEWGRCQDDGPGSRIITMSIYAAWCLEKGSQEQKEYVRSKLYPGGEGENTGVIKGDLDYVARHWDSPGFDLWEEVSGLHFYTLLTLRTSLIDGALLATALDDPTSAEHYRSVAAKLTPTINRFWSPSKQIVRVTLDHTRGRESTENAHVGDAEYGKKSELDTAVVLAVLHAGRESSWSNLTAGEEDDESATKILSTLKHLMDEMGTLYPLNGDRRSKKQGVALGRYPEDEYDGVGLSIAHPWYLCTAAAAEYLYLLVSHLSQLPSDSQGFLLTPLLHETLTSILTPISLPSTGSYLAPKSPEFEPLLRALTRLADSFLEVIQKFVGEGGRLDEQIEREGKPRGSEKHEDGEVEDGKKEGEVIGRGARELTWSHAALITACWTRKEAEVALNALEK